ncbi:MAG: hypothetical protein M3N51_07780 [Actinomycetota bacterium]|nr:hypothetical protein [Actinomycetota bacterium]
MERQRLESILDETERALAAGRPVELGELGFWKAVGEVKRRPEWVEEYADRIGALDRRAFEQRVSLTFSPPVGNAILSLGALAGLVLVWGAGRARSPWNVLLLLGGAGALLGSTHGLAHVLVGKVVGIRFTHWFLDGPTRLQPGAKIDYASYLRTPPRSRAVMHASGAVVTKVVPFLLLPTARAPRWVTRALAAVGLGQIVTDLTFSVRLSDWKRFRREMRVARRLEGAG